MLFRASFLAFSAAICLAQPGLISTVIGNGTSGAGGDGGFGKTAQLNNPQGVAVDAVGNIYVADYGNSKIRRLLTTSDTMQTMAGCGAVSGSCINQTEGRLAGETLINFPWDVVLDSSGNFYFPDSGLNRIRKVGNPGFILTNFAGTTTGFAGDGGPATAARLNNPVGMAIDATGNIFFTDLNNQRVRKIDTAGIISTIAGSGVAGFGGDGGPATSARLSGPHGLAVDAAGNVYIADTNNYRIRKVTPGGTISTVAGVGLPTGAAPLGDLGPATNATFVPWDVEVDPLGTIYISDWLGHRIRRVDAITGIITTIAGNGISGFSGEGVPSANSQVSSPAGMALDTQGNLYFADSGNNRIRKINAPPLGLPTIRFADPVVPSFMGKAGFSSNTYVEIYGTNFSRSARIWGESDFNGANAPTSLNGVSVTVNGKPAFIYYVSPGQININVPDEAFAGSAAFQVKTSEGLSNVVTLTSSHVSPTMLTTPTFRIAGKQHVVALTTPDFASYIGRPNMIPGVSFVAPRPGDTVVVYALGLGPTNPPTQAGVKAVQNSTVILPLQVKIGNVDAQVPFKGLVQGTIGLYQLNIVIPNVAAGDQPIELIVDGIRNQQDLTIVVGP